jgi:methanogenic corrinoid protein MtbC1
VAHPAAGSVDLASAYRDYLAALLARDSQRARAVVARALEDGAEPGDVALNVLCPTLREIGRRWEEGELSVAHEHYATGITEGVMAVVAARMRQPPVGGRLAVVACPGGERHGLAARVVGDFFEAQGWEAIVTGPDVPARDLLELIADEQPDVVCVSTTMPANIEPTFELLGALGTCRPRPLLVIGGQAWDGGGELARALGADVIAQDPRELMDVLRERLPPLPEDEE